MADEGTPAKGEEGAKPGSAAQVPEGGTNIYHQAENPDAVQNALKAERKAAREATKERDALAAKVAEFEERGKSEQEKLIGKVESLTSERDTGKMENLRLRVAIEKQLPTELIDRLKGSNQDELEADADKLLALVKEPAPSFDAGAREPAPEAKDPYEAHTDTLLRAFGRDPSVKP